MLADPDLGTLFRVDSVSAGSIKDSIFADGGVLSPEFLWEVDCVSELSSFSPDKSE